MNRCITCGKIVTPRRAETVIEQEGNRQRPCRMRNVVQMYLDM